MEDEKLGSFMLGSLMVELLVAFFSEQLQGAKPKQKTKQIAGIDQEEVDDPTVLADSDSCFCEFNGVQLHHKICDAELSPPDTLLEGSAPQSPNSTKRVNFPMILLHGFGASVFSWNRVMKPLAQVAGSKVLAFDRPAFGLTSRVNAIKHPSPGNQDSRPLNPYSMMFSVLATLYFIDFLAAEKAILIVRHSAGALVAVDAYFEAPERVAALILVAPAIFAPLTMQNIAKDNQAGTENQVPRNNSDLKTSGNLFFRLGSILSKFTKIIAEAIVHMVKGMAIMINSLYKKALSAILRSTLGVMVIRMIINKFGIPAVRSAWYDSNQVSDHVVQGYTKVTTCYTFSLRWMMPTFFQCSARLIILKCTATEGEGLGQGTSGIHGGNANRFRIRIKTACGEKA
ncbi:hypothetical protein DH2020_030704 [Rehmannia glutinosa]|uniref:AB hydrolase-1 domain-containing protein n=1 Tax=Rehmannia glutinosa TaxID=99300 RepID=A0ABR0VK19_REHGL